MYSCLLCLNLIFNYTKFTAYLDLVLSTFEDTISIIYYFDLSYHTDKKQNHRYIDKNRNLTNYLTTLDFKRLEFEIKEEILAVIINLFVIQKKL